MTLSKSGDDEMNVISRLFLGIENSFGYFFASQRLIEQQKVFHSLRRTVMAHENSIMKSVFEDIKFLDTKSSALLTLISVMLASNLFMIDKSPNVYLSLFLIFEICMYTLAALMLLRSFNTLYADIFKLGDSLTEAGFESFFVREVTIRKNMYFMASKIVFVAILLFPLAGAFFYFS